MKKHLLTLLTSAMILGGIFSVSTASLSFAQTPPVVNPNPSPNNTVKDQNQGLNIRLNNPLSGISTIPEAINTILSIVIRIALPLIIIAFIWSGLSFIFARGNPEKMKVAKNMFFYTVIGTLLILGAWTITNAIVGTVNSIVN